MTETAAMVAALSPKSSSQAGARCGSALPHARLTVNEEGVIQLTAQSLFHGYYTERAQRGRCMVHG